MWLLGKSRLPRRLASCFYRAALVQNNTHVWGCLAEALCRTPHFKHMIGLGLEIFFLARTKKKKKKKKKNDTDQRRKLKDKKVLLLFIIWVFSQKLQRLQHVKVPRVRACCPSPASGTWRNKISTCH